MTHKAPIQKNMSFRLYEGIPQMEMEDSVPGFDGVFVLNALSQLRHSHKSLFLRNTLQDLLLLLQLSLHGALLFGCKHRITSLPIDTKALLLHTATLYSLQFPGLTFCFNNLQSSSKGGKNEKNINKFI